MEFRQRLHDLCQPLTTLQCRLYLGAMARANARTDATECVTECERA